MFKLKKLFITPVYTFQMPYHNSKATGIRETAPCSAKETPYNPCIHIPNAIPQQQSNRIWVLLLASCSMRHCHSWSDRDSSNCRLTQWWIAHSSLVPKCDTNWLVSNNLTPNITDCYNNVLLLLHSANPSSGPLNFKEQHSSPGQISNSCSTGKIFDVNLFSGSTA